MAKLSQREVEAYLGRSLTPKEKTNFNSNYDTAQKILESILCISLKTQDKNSRHKTYKFEARDGYSTVFTGIFRNLQDVKVNGETTTNYKAMFWDNRNTTTYNSIVFNKPLRHNDTVEVKARWGYHKLPSDLGRLLAQMIGVVGSRRLIRKIKSKHVEGTGVSYTDSTEMEQFVADNEVTINKYSMCYIGEFRSGRVY